MTKKKVIGSLLLATSTVFAGCPENFKYVYNYEEVGERCCASPVSKKTQNRNGFLGDYCSDSAVRCPPGKKPCEDHPTAGQEEVASKAANCASDWFAVIDFNFMGLASAFYLDYIDGELNGDLFAKNAEETDPEFIKRCLDSCDSDCNIVKVERWNGYSLCDYFFGSFEKFNMDWSDNEIIHDNYDLYLHSAFSIFPPDFSDSSTHDLAAFNGDRGSEKPMLIFKRAFAEGHLAGELGDGDMNQNDKRYILDNEFNLASFICDAETPLWTEWAEWSGCPVTCGGNSMNGRQRSRSCEGGNEGDPGCQGASEETEVCNAQDCPVWGEWSAFGGCDATCGGGSQFRYRACVNGDPGDAGCDTGNAVDEQFCNDHTCPVWDQWSEWSGCDATCGGGSRSRSRICQNGNAGDIGCHVGETSDTDVCNEHDCPVWDQWSDWSGCDATCGGGATSRSRTCENGVVGDIGCEIGDDSETAVCENQDCPVWDQWSDWTGCDATCGGGATTRSRTCQNGDAGEIGCHIGQTSETAVCNDQDCPVWEQWSDWSGCDVTCGGGETSRLRACINGDPGDVGCDVGGTSEKENCNNQDCPVWSNWESWGMCSLSCGGGTTNRERYCENGSIGQIGCDDSNNDSKPCNEQACPPCEAANGGCSDICDHPGGPDDWAATDYTVVCSCRNKKVLDPADSKTCVSPCDVENGGCDENCHWTTDTDRYCSCNMPNVLDPADSTEQHCTLELCEFEMHGCHKEASCSDSAEGPVCECNSPLTGDGYKCTQCPGHDECWTFNATTFECSMKPSCSSLSCESDAMRIEMNPMLFGLTEPDDAIWASRAKPDFIGDKLVYGAALGHENMLISTTEKEESIITQLWFAISGNNRQRSSVRANEINLGGDLAVYSSNVGISVEYRCEYSTKVTIAAQSFDVEQVSAFGQNHGFGYLANAFALSLSSASEARDRFIMGSLLEVEVSWNARFLGDFSFTLDQCSVDHGDVSIAIIKNGCYSELLKTTALDTDDNHRKAFEYQIFKTNDESAMTQTITCWVSVCKNYCTTPQVQSDCEEDEVLNYRLP